MIQITKNIAISENELEEEFVCSSGPGGQNVNKVSTAVKLRFDAENSPSLSETVKKRLRKVAGRHITKEGVVIIDARAERTQEMNRKDALKRLKAMIIKAAEKPKRRRPTKPTRGSKERRLKKKKERSHLKQTRRGSISVE